MFLVLIETSGNQNYIFSTNKLKENIGASELTYRAGTKWVLEAVEKVTSSKWSLWKNNEQLRDKLLDKKLNKPIESSKDIKVEIIVATSGKALLLTQDRETAKYIIQYVTYQALVEAPGLDICGVFEPFNWKQNDLGEINRKLHKKFEFVRSQRPSPNLRFLRLPVIDECSTSGLPASQLEEIKLDGKDKSVLRSKVSCSKRQYSFEGFARIEEFIKRENLNFKIASSFRVLDEELRKQKFPDESQEDFNNQDNKKSSLDWVAVVHADGNGLGEVFLNFGEYVENNRDYVDKYRKFSIALDICTEKAFLSALETFETEKDNLIPIIPLILGGDDLTVICDGKFALKFTEKFLLNFECETQSNDNLEGIIPKIAKKALDVERLSACAGVAIIKPHFPSSVAYQLAEHLMQSAKNVKKKIVNSKTDKPYPCSALDFHILYDSSNVELDQIRGKLEIENEKEKNLLHTRPYVVTDIQNIQEAKGKDWAEFHQWENLIDKVKTLISHQDGKRQLPNSQMHDLRVGLFLGRKLADARYQLIRSRYLKQGIQGLEGEPGSLFQQEPQSGTYMTGLLDAIDAAEFLNMREQNNEQKTQ